MLLDSFVRQALARRSESLPSVAAWRAVRDLPYALDGAHDAEGLLAVGRGDCLAKSELMKLAAEALGMTARYVCWLYLLPDVVPEVADLPSRLDVHRAVQVRIGARWILADATHHPGLRGTPLAVSDWDGRHDTAPAHTPIGQVIAEDEDPVAAKLIRGRAQQWISSCPQGLLVRWRSAYIAWLRKYERHGACGQWVT
jgi:transglutaminase-like putative cysteine protease